MIIDVDNVKLIKTNVIILSQDPLRGLLKVSREFEIGGDSANGLLDGVLALFGMLPWQALPVGSGIAG